MGEGCGAWLRAAGQGLGKAGPRRREVGQHAVWPWPLLRLRPFLEEAPELRQGFVDAAQEGFSATRQGKVQAGTGQSEDADAAGILLNANENPFSFDDRHLNRYPDPQPADLRERMQVAHPLLGCNC